MTLAVRLTRVPDPDREETCVLALEGDLDHTNAEELRAGLNESFDPRYRDLVLDLTELTFCDSTGIRVFLGLRRVVLDRGGAVALAAMNARLLRIFEVTGLTHAFALRPTIAEALSSLPSARTEGAGRPQP